MLDFRLSTKEKVPSIGDFHKNEEGTESEKVLDIPDWSQGSRMRANNGWFKMIKKKMCEDIEGVQ